MFERFKKRKLIHDLDKTLDELEAEYSLEKQKNIQLASNDFFKFLIGYLEAKIEINRDKIDLLDENKKKDRQKETMLKAELRVWREFIHEINELKKLYEQEAELERVGVQS